MSLKMNRFGATFILALLILKPIMIGAIFYSSKYGSTAQYATWIAEATGLPAFNMEDSTEDPARYDFLILGSPIIYFRLRGRKWVKKNLKKLLGKPLIYYTLSGAPAGPKLDKWISKSLPDEIVAEMKHVTLGGRQHPKELNWFDWIMLKIAGLTNPDREAGRDEMHGFDYMDKASIAPILDLVEEFQMAEV